MKTVLRQYLKFSLVLERITNVVNKDVNRVSMTGDELCGIISLLSFFYSTRKITIESLLSPRTLGRVGNGGKSRSRFKLLRLGCQINCQCAMTTHAVSKDGLPGPVLNVFLFFFLVSVKK